MGKPELGIRGVLFFAIDIINSKAMYIPSSSEYAEQLVLNGNFPGIIGEPTKDPETGFIELDGISSRKLQILPGLTAGAKVVPYNEVLIDDDVIVVASLMTDDSAADVVSSSSLVLITSTLSLLAAFLCL